MQSSTRLDLIWIKILYGPSTNILDIICFDILYMHHTMYNQKVCQTCVYNVCLCEYGYTSLRVCRIKQDINERIRYRIFT